MITPRLIYALVDPSTQEVRYVGATVDLERRLQEHLRRRYETHCSRWIVNLLACDMAPAVWVLERDLEAWQDAERKWIAYFRSAGEPLTNLTDGGEGHAGFTVSEEIRAKISSGASRWQRGRTLSKRHRINLGKAARRALANPDYFARRSEILRAAAATGGSAGKGKPKSAEHNRKNSEAQRARHARRRLAAVAATEAAA